MFCVVENSLDSSLIIFNILNHLVPGVSDKVSYSGVRFSSTPKKTSRSINILDIICPIFFFLII